MKLEILITTVSVMLSCTSVNQKNKEILPSNSKNMNSKQSLQQQTPEDIFYSQTQGGEKKQTYFVVETDEELNLLMGRYNRIEVLSLEEKAKEKGVKIPTGKKAVIYHFGTFRSGDHKPLGVESLELKDSILIVNMKPRKSSGMYAIQVVSNPWMVFSVPKNYEFKDIKINQKVEQDKKNNGYKSLLR